MPDLQHGRVVDLKGGAREGLVQHAGHLVRQLLVLAREDVEEDDGRAGEEAQRDHLGQDHAPPLPPLRRGREPAAPPLREAGPAAERPAVAAALAGLEEPPAEGWDPPVPAGGGAPRERAPAGQQPLSQPWELPALRHPAAGAPLAALLRPPAALGEAAGAACAGLASQLLLAKPWYNMLARRDCAAAGGDGLVATSYQPLCASRANPLFYSLSTKCSLTTPQSRPTPVSGPQPADACFQSFATLIAETHIAWLEAALQSSTENRLRY